MDASFIMIERCIPGGTCQPSTTSYLLFTLDDKSIFIHPKHYTACHSRAWDMASNTRVSRHTRLISAAGVAEGPQPDRVPCKLPFYYTILY